MAAEKVHSPIKEVYDQLDVDKPLPLVRAGHSMKADMQFGWKPTASAQSDVPIIPLCFGLVEYNTDDLIKLDRILYMGPRY